MLYFVLGSGDFVMAELQSKLKGRGKVEPACSLAEKNKAKAAPSPRRPLKDLGTDKLASAPSFQKELKSPQEISREESSIVPLEESTQQTAMDGKVRAMCLNLESSSGSSVAEEGTSPSSVAPCKPTIVDLSVLGEVDKSIRTGSEDHAQHTEEAFKAPNGTNVSPQQHPKSLHAWRRSPVCSQPQAKSLDGKPVDVCCIGCYVFLHAQQDFDCKHCSV